VDALERLRDLSRLTPLAWIPRGVSSRDRKLLRSDPHFAAPVALAPLRAGPYTDYIQSTHEEKESGVKYATQIKPISFFKANAAEIIRTLAKTGEPLVITQHGEAKAVIQDVASFDATQETLAILKILALGNRQIEHGRVVAASDTLERLRAVKTRD